MACGDGATTSSPVVPSRITGVPAAIRDDASCKPTTAGTLSERARIAVWYVRLPASTRKSLDACPVELRGERRGELVGDEHRRAVQFAEQIAGAAGAVAQVHPQAAGDIGDVVFTLAQVLVLDAGEDAPSSS